MDREQGRELKRALVEASDALAHLDADRLEEMALSCEALAGDKRFIDRRAENRDEPGGRDSSTEMAIFMRVLEATRANLNVMRRLREMRTSQLEYGRGPAASRARAEAE